jgi:hypothetical protein
MFTCYDKNVKLSLQEAVEIHRFVRLRGFHVFVDNRPTDGDEVANLMRLQAALYPQEDFWYWFLSEAESTPGP